MVQACYDCCCCRCCGGCIACCIRRCRPLPLPCLCSDSPAAAAAAAAAAPFVYGAPTAHSHRCGTTPVEAATARIYAMQRQHHPHMSSRVLHAGGGRCRTALPPARSRCLLHQGARWIDGQTEAACERPSARVQYRHPQPQASPISNLGSCNEPHKKGERSGRGDRHVQWREWGAPPRATAP
jgi:hypothetical protein